MECWTWFKNVQFNNTNNQFQKKLAQDAEKIKKDDKLLVAADKTTNFYRLDPPTYNKLLEDNITKAYKKAPMNAVSRIINHDKRIATDLDLDNRIDVTAKNNAFVTLKDHKPNFNNKPVCRLINPSKSEIGIISKKYLKE